MGAPMKRIYKYKGFEVSVEFEAVWDSCASLTLRLPAGFLAVADSSVTSTSRTLVSQLRLTAEHSNPFPTKSDALMSPYSVAQRIIDDTLLSS